MRTCPDCHSLVNDNAIFCDNCGFRLQPVERELEPTIKSEIPAVSKPAPQAQQDSTQTGACSSCGFLNLPGEMFCQNCGVQLAPVTSSPPPPPVLVEPPISEPGVAAGGSQDIPGPPSPAESTVPEELPPVVAETKTLGCPNCGFQNMPGEKYCQNCGQLLEQALAAQAKPTPVEMPEAEQEPDIQPSEEIFPAAGETGEDREGETGAQDAKVLHGEPLTDSAAEQPEPGDESRQEEAPQETPSSEDTGAPVPEEGIPEPPDTPEPPAAVEALPPAQGSQPSSERGIRGKLVVRSTGVEIPLPSGHDEITIGRVDLVRNIFPDIDMSGYGGESSGVSRMHARLVMTGTQLYIEDLNSTNYTFVNKLRLQPGQPYLVSEGDEIRLGLLAMIFHSS